MDMMMPADEILDIPEPEHVEVIFKALSDTVVPDVAGVEGLTKAQTYAFAVLRANGQITQREAIAGTEGFFSAVGAGARKVFEYIEKMFKNVWNFFFGKSETGLENIMADTEKTLKQNQDSLKAWAAQDAKLRENVNAQWIKTEADLDAFMKGSTATPSEKQEAEKAKETMEAAKDKPDTEKVKVVAEAMEKVAKINSRTQKGLEEAGKKAVAEYEKYRVLARVDHSDKFNGTIFESEYNSYKHTQLEFAKKGIEQYVMVPQGMRTLGDAARAQEGLSKVITDLNGEARSISKGIKADLISRIKGLQEKVDRPNSSDAAKVAFQKSLDACTLLLKLTTEVILQLKGTAENVKRISNMINRLFGVAPRK